MHLWGAPLLLSLQSSISLPLCKTAPLLVQVRMMGCPHSTLGHATTTDVSWLTSDYQVEVFKGRCSSYRPMNSVKAWQAKALSAYHNCQQPSDDILPFTLRCFTATFLARLDLLAAFRRRLRKASAAFRLAMRRLLR